MALVDSITNTSVRDVEKISADHFRKQFIAAMDTARKARKLENPFSDSDSENNVAAAPSQARNYADMAVVELTFGGGG